MYLDLGERTSVLKSDVIGVFDMDSTTVSRKTREYLNYQQKQQTLAGVSDDLPLSFVVCGEKTYLSPIRSQTLAAR